MKKSIEYLDEEFPKGKSKLRGEAMVLMAMVAIDEREKICEMIEEHISIAQHKHPEQKLIVDLGNEILSKIRGEE